MRLIIVIMLFLIQKHNVFCATIPVEDDSKSVIQPKAIVFEDPSDVSVFYSLRSNLTIKDMGPRPWMSPSQSLRLPFIGDPCSCNGLQCGCCAGIRISQINFDRQICANISYDANLFGLVLNVTIDNSTVFTNNISAKNPPPICWPIPLGPIPGVTLCVKLFDIYTQNLTSIHICMDWEISVVSFPVLVLHFDCVNVGSNGVQFVKPGAEDVIDPETSESSESTNGTQSGNSGDIYDEVTLDVKTAITTTENPRVNYVFDDDDDFESISNFESKKIIT